MPTEKFDVLIKAYGLFLCVLVGLTIVTFSFPLGEKLNLYPVEFTYYLAGVIIGVIAMSIINIIRKGLKVFDEPYDEPKPKPRIIDLYK